MLMCKLIIIIINLVMVLSVHEKLENILKKWINLKQQIFLLLFLLLLCFCSVFHNTFLDSGLLTQVHLRAWLVECPFNWPYVGQRREEGMEPCHQFIHFKQSSRSQIIPLTTYLLPDADWSWQVAPTNVHGVNGHWQPLNDECQVGKAGQRYNI